LCALFVLYSLPAHAAPSSTDKAMATQLYDDAETLMQSKDFAGACPKYAESQRLDPQLGVLLHLADCYEKAGKTASAWASFKDAIEVAARRNASGVNEPRERIARDRAEALAAKLSRITIKVTKPDLVGLEVTQDGQVVGRAIWGSAAPVDPGVHTVTAKAPGNKTWTKEIKLGPDGAKETVVVPSLEIEAATPAPVVAPAPETLPVQGAVSTAGFETAPGASSQRTIAYVVGGVGVVGLVAGTVFGLTRSSAVSERDGICPSNRCTRDESNRIDDLTSKAKSDAMLSNIAFGIGGAALVGGVVLFLTARPSQPAKAAAVTRIHPWGGAGSAGLAVGGEW
jgi:serine/threonine-protein kinase